MSFKPLTSIRSFRNSSSTSASSPTRGKENCSFSIRLDIVNMSLVYIKKIFSFPGGRSEISDFEEGESNKMLTNPCVAKQ